MARFSDDAARRTVKAVRHVELQLQRPDRPERPQWVEPNAEEQWYQLTEWLPPGKSAPSYRLHFDASANAGKGGYAQDTTREHLVYDFSAGQPAAKGEWVRGKVAGAESRLAWEPLQGHEEIWRYELEEDLPICGSARVHFLDANLDTITWVDEDGNRSTYTDYLYDPLGIAKSSPWYDAANCLLPAGYRGYAKWMSEAAAMRWELLDVGECGCSSSSSDESSQQPSSDESSQQPSSDGSSQQPSGSDKSTAIVPASWSPSGYTALFVAECPEVRFDDLLIVEGPATDTTVRIDRRYLEVCEPGSIEVCGVTVDAPLLIGARVDGHRVRLRFASPDPSQQVRTVIRLSGIRKGFAFHRFPNRTREQFEANERFIQSAYPGA